jgi:hypothetical protein
MTTPITTPASNQTSNTHQSIKDTLASLTTEEVHAKFPAVFAAQPKQTPEDTALVNDLVKQGITPIAMLKRNIPPIADLFSEWVVGSDGKKTRDYTNGAKRLMAVDLLVDAVDALGDSFASGGESLAKSLVRYAARVNTVEALITNLTAKNEVLIEQNGELTAQNEALTAYVNDLAARLDALDAKLEQRATMPTVGAQGEAPTPEAPTPEAPTPEAPTPEAPTSPIKDLGGVPAKISAEMSKIEKAKAKAKEFAAKTPQPAQAPVAPTVTPVAPTALAQSAVAEAIAMDFGGDLAEVGDNVADADLEV